MSGRYARSRAGTALTARSKRCSCIVRIMMLGLDQPIRRACLAAFFVWLSERPNFRPLAFADDKDINSYTATPTSTQRWIDGKERRYAEFGSSKQWKTVSHREAMDQYLLRRRDLDGLPYVAKYNVYGATGGVTPARLTRFYVVYDVQDRALTRWGSKNALDDERERRRRVRERRRARVLRLVTLLRPVRTNKGEVIVGSNAVFAAIVGNCGVVCAKLVGWGATGSGSMLSEAFHSLADLGNQLMLAIGLQQSMRRPDVSRPYGYGFEQYVWAMISGVSTFILGAGASVYHGVHLLMHPGELESLPTACAVLGACGVLESYTLSVAWKELKSEASKIGMTPREYLIDGPDPLNPAVLLEDSVAVVGIGVAAGSIGLTLVTGNPAYDAIGSITVGTMMGVSVECGRIQDCVLRAAYCLLPAACCLFARWRALRLLLRLRRWRQSACSRLLYANGCLRPSPSSSSTATASSSVALCRGALRMWSRC